MKKISLLSLFAVLVLFQSCKKDNSDWTFEQDNAIATEMLQDVYKQVDGMAQSDGKLKTCALATLSDTLGNFPNTLTIDFGTGCTGQDLRTRSGKIIASFTGRWRTPNSEITVTTDNYKVNGYAVNGTTTIRNNGFNNNGNLSYTVTTTNGTVTDTAGQSIQWNASTTYEWVAGMSTDFVNNGINGIYDDVYHITGSANGVNRNGNAYTANITYRLEKALACRWIKSGTIEISPANGDPRTLDFGNGDCDASATFRFRQWTLNFLMP